MSGMNCKSQTPFTFCSVRVIRMSEVAEADRERLRRFGRDWVKGFTDSNPEHMLQAARLYWWKSRVIPE